MILVDVLSARRRDAWSSVAMMPRSRVLHAAGGRPRVVVARLCEPHSSPQLGDARRRSDTAGRQRLLRAGPPRRRATCGRSRTTGPTQQRGHGPRRSWPGCGRSASQANVEGRCSPAPARRVEGGPELARGRESSARALASGPLLKSPPTRIGRSPSRSASANIRAIPALPQLDERRQARRVEPPRRRNA